MTFTYSDPPNFLSAVNQIMWYSDGNTPLDGPYGIYEYVQTGTESEPPAGTPPVAHGTDTFSTAGVPVGKYTVYLLYNNGYTVIGRPITLRVTSTPNPYLSASASSVTAGTPVTLSYSTPAGFLSTSNWIGWYDHTDTPQDGYVGIWDYTQTGTQSLPPSGSSPVASGTVTFSTAGLVPGNYAVYLFYDDGYTIIENPVTIQIRPTHVTGAPAPHIMTIMMENTDYSMIAGAASAPYLNQLAHQYADFTNAFGWEYPSLPNYVALAAGTADGISGDCASSSCGGLTSPTLMDQLNQAGISWNAYYQGDVSGCSPQYGGNTSPRWYAGWHNALSYFADFSVQCSHIDDFGHLLSDLNSPHPADLQWVVPDLVNDDDNGSTQAADSWLNSELPKIMASTWYKQGGQIVILWDSGYYTLPADEAGLNGSSGGHIALTVVSAHDKGMGAVTAPVNDAGVLRSIEHAYGVPYLAGAADPANGSLGDALVSGRQTSGPPSLISQGSTLSVQGTTQQESLAEVPGTLALNGIAALPGPGTTGKATPVIEVGQNARGNGVVVAPGRGASVVSGTAALESVACTTSTQCYAVGLASANTDDAALVSITNGHVASVTELPTFIGLYGIACPTTSTCYAVGYDTAHDADAVTTITNGTAGDPVEVAGGARWLNAISCPTATQCYAVGYTGADYNPSITPITSGQPGTPVALSTPLAASPAGNVWYVNGIDCPSVGNCLAVGESDSQQGIVAALVNGSAGSAAVVAGTEFLYGVACQTADHCLLAGAGTPGADGYSNGVVVPLTGGVAGRPATVPDANGFGQVIPYGEAGYMTVGAVYVG